MCRGSIWGILKEVMSKQHAKKDMNEGQARESSPFVCPLLTHFLTAHLVHFDDKNGEFACTAGKQLFLPNIPQAAQM